MKNLGQNLNINFDKKTNFKLYNIGNKYIYRNGYQRGC